jgi:hypothetical protein
MKLERHSALDTKIGNVLRQQPLKIPPLAHPCNKVSLRFGTPPLAAAHGFPANNLRAAGSASRRQMSTFRFLPPPVRSGSMGFTMAQEAFMKWSRIEASWMQLKDKFAFWSFRLSHDDSESFGLIGAEISRVSQSDESHPTAFHPDERGRRSEFSLHIGC